VLSSRSARLTRILERASGEQERLLHRRAIDREARAYDLRGMARRMVEQHHHVLAPIVREFHRPIQQQDFLRASGLLLA
jgi:hypothetical protein